ncbi:type II CAAX prenyl endopeptidase Rce1 family protein [Paenibacillus sp. GCM10012306]|uniref:CPBP family glutamic-type intramembrane protease n=1 Tax=Paenibacillus sp. GCM10012306 TaxID=3317342 RepID=UPI003610018E
MRTDFTNPPATGAIGEQERIRRARRGLLVFFAGLIPLSILGYVLALQSELFVLLLMWAPGLASIIARLVLREGIADISLKIGFKKLLKTLPMVLLFPVIIGFLGYGIAWTTGLVQFVAPDGTKGSPEVAFLVAVLMQMTVGTLIGLITSSGEELGWRGYMTTRLVDARIPRPLLVGGIIWGVWHLPIIILGNYNSGSNLAVSILLFMVSVSSFAYILGRLRLTSGSLWPAVLLHASWNAIIQDAFDAYTGGTNAMLWTGESGILVALFLLLAAWMMSRRPIRVHQL